MKIDLAAVKAAHEARPEWRRAGHTAAARVRPNMLQYDYLGLATLAADVDGLIAEACRLSPAATPVALDVGCDLSPYSGILAKHGWRVETLDIAPGPGVDHVGMVERTELPEASFDLVLCTQVIEHCLDPWAALRELHRIVRPGGYLVWTVPQVWFYHPHPDDNWRFTPEGVTRLSETGGFEVVQLLLQGGPVIALLQIFNFCLFGVAGRYGAPIYLLSNVCGRIVDPLIPNPSFSLNVACLCRK
jgi:SAM-dependent methyltransferase